MDWQPDVVFEFLDLYEKEEVLWNPRHPYYKQKNQITDAWNRIALDFSLGLSVPELKRKKDSLLSSFRNQARRVADSLKSGAAIYKPTWFAYDRIASFLPTVHSLPLRPINSENSQEDEQHLQEDYGALDTLLKEEDLGCFDDTDADVNVEDTNSNTDSMPTASNTDSTPTASDQTGIRPRPTLARKRPATTTVQHKPETVQSKVQRVPDFCREDDEFDLFGKSIAVQLRNMPLERALVCQETLQAVMKQERLYQLHHMS